MAEFIYQMYQARKAHGDKVILDDVTLSFYPGAKIGVVGPNGMGKSTLLKIMAGLEEVSNGDARLTPGYTVGILQQEPPLDDDKTVIENIEMAFGEVKAKIDRFNKIGEEMAEPDADFDALMAEMGELQDAIDAANGWDLDSQLSQAMDALQCPDPDMPVNVLSGGERRRVALCKLLLEAPDLLLLDEPTNHLDARVGAVAGAVPAHLPRRGAGRHARPLLPGQRGRVDLRGGPRQPLPVQRQLLHLPRDEAARLEGQGQREEKLAKRLRSELEWVRSSPKARQAKSKARIERYEQMAAEARSFEKASVSDITIPVPPRLGAKVIEAKHIKKAFGDRVLIDDLSFTLPQGGIVGVIGPNGVGKSTLFKAIVGLEPLSGGELEIGESVSISYVDQNREGIDPNKKLWEVVSDGLELHEGGRHRDSQSRLRGQLRLQGRRPAEADRRAVGRRAQPPEPGADAQAGRQPAASRRAYERPRRRDAGKPGGGAAGISRLRRGDQP